MFDWADYLTLADELASRTGDEAAERTAVNRAYYAAFGVARRHLIRSGVAIPRIGAAHTHVWTSFHDTPDLTQRRIANLGRRLLRRRRRADYDDPYPALSADAPLAVAWARRVLTDLAALPSPTGGGRLPSLPPASVRPHNPAPIPAQARGILSPYGPGVRLSPWWALSHAALGPGKGQEDPCADS